MKIEFKNGNKIDSIYVDKNKNTRGNRSRIIGCNCYDIVTDTWVFYEIDLGNPIDRYIPEWLYAEWLVREEN